MTHSSVLGGSMVNPTPYGTALLVYLLPESGNGVDITHMDPFCSWHRPYLMVIEQTIQKHAIAIATQFTVDKEAWQKVAVDLRQPYWDWTANSLPPDVVIRDEHVTITDFKGQKVQVVNPLIRYRFKSTLPFHTPFEKWHTTLRHPDATGKEKIDELVRILENAQTQIRDDTVALLSWIHDWAQFSNHTDDDNSITNSLEAIHDYIHVEVGGEGHMADTGVAAFDPIFFLHHCNVDRLFSLWAAMKPGKGVTTGKNDQGGTFTLAPLVPLDENTDLSPFWDSQNTFWCSKNIFNTQTFRYTYPDFVNVNQDDHVATKAAAERVTSGYVDRYFAKSIFTVQPDAKKLWNWTVRIRTKKFELGRSFSMLIFLGNVPAETSVWRMCSSFVGVHHVFTNSAAGRCANCQANADMIHEGFIHMNRHLCVTLPEAVTFDPRVVEPYLTEKLHWRTIDICSSSPFCVWLVFVVLVIDYVLSRLADVRSMLTCLR
ncbi:hypothetical protein AMATHDRAFT_54855 [Amanita thiersii Skay4041]|uniref:tyrosinase n=1 Tax=Amanita thiersii Skay4041 TaxID=703135 RepID=A0A2A9NYK6_9AGAR|nr:hypothetical protein AMATHDRAFT_54855 [Amanita thiersii Skay4041]